MVIPINLQKYDFRTNLICDKDNPILIQKAWRDYYDENKSKKTRNRVSIGETFLGQPHGEDALTWNVFRSLQMKGNDGLQAIGDIFSLSSVQSMLFWGCDCDVQHTSDLQQLLSILIRTIDGRWGGTITEPDLILFSESEVVFCECKLNSRDKQKSPWSASEKENDGAQKRMSDYKQRFPELIRINDWRPVYQLIRQYVYAKELAKVIDKTPRVVPLINPRHYDLLNRWYDSLMIYGQFRPMLTWEDVKNKLSHANLSNTALIIEKINSVLKIAK